MNKMSNLDNKIRDMILNLDLVPQSINPAGFTFFGEGKLQRNTARVYTLICNISQFHESTSEGIRWLCLQLNIQTDIHSVKPENLDNLYQNIKSYIWDENNKDEETEVFYLFETKQHEADFLSECRFVKKPEDIITIAKAFEFDIYETAELLCAAIFGETMFITTDYNSTFEQPLIAAMVYAKCVSLALIKPDNIKNNI